MKVHDIYIANSCEGFWVGSNHLLFQMKSNWEPLYQYGKISKEYPAVSRFKVLRTGSHRPTSKNLPPQIALRLWSPLPWWKQSKVLQRWFSIGSLNGCLAAVVQKVLSVKDIISMVPLCSSLKMSAIGLWMRLVWKTSAGRPKSLPSTWNSVQKA